MENKNIFPIFIPSRGRSDYCFTARCLEKDNADFKIVVEEWDFANYLRFFDSKKLIVLPESNAGLAYVRNFIKDYAHKSGFEYHWQIDDNIRSFKRIVENIKTDLEPWHIVEKKYIKSSVKELLLEVESYVTKHSNIGAANLAHQNFSSKRKGELHFNGVAYSCILIKSGVDARFRSGIVEDTDFALQLLYSGLCTVRFNKLIIAKEATGKIKGGMTDFEHLNRFDFYSALQKEYPGWFKIIRQYGRAKLLPSRVWRTFRQRPKLIDELIHENKKEQMEIF